jgi:hypothetical protein
VIAAADGHDEATIAGSARAALPPANENTPTTTSIAGTCIRISSL